MDNIGANADRLWDMRRGRAVPRGAREDFVLLAMPGTGTARRTAREALAVPRRGRSRLGRDAADRT